MKKIITSKNAPSPIGPYNQAVIANGFMYISGQVGMNPKTGKIIKDSIYSFGDTIIYNNTSFTITLNSNFNFLPSNKNARGIIAKNPTKNLTALNVNGPISSMPVS